VNAGTAGGVLIPDLHKLFFNDIGGEHIFGDGNSMVLTTAGDVFLKTGGVDYRFRSVFFLIPSSTPIRFRDSGLNINSSVDGQLDINADVELELAAPRIQLEGKVNLGAEGDLTISAGGAVAVTKTYHSIIVNGGGGSGNDQLDTATGGSEGDLLVLKANTTGGSDTVTVADGTGADTFILAGGANFVMDHVDDRLTLLHNGTEWVELSRSTNS
ncbi:hypothetical protein LCGC14_2473600, partial [marine sediment metagenome]